MYSHKMELFPKAVHKKKGLVNETGWPSPDRYYMTAIVIAMFVPLYSILLFIESVIMWKAVVTENGDLFWSTKPTADFLMYFGIILSIVIMAVLIFVLLFK